MIKICPKPKKLIPQCFLYLKEKNKIYNISGSTEKNC